jgi:hypothetical protein
LSEALFFFRTHLPRGDHTDLAPTTSLKDHEQIPTGEALPVCQKAPTPPAEDAHLAVKNLFDFVRPDPVSRDMSNVTMVPLEASNTH